jgi:hypothetical protein
MTQWPSGRVKSKYQKRDNIKDLENPLRSTFEIFENSVISVGHIV